MLTIKYVRWCAVAGAVGVIVLLVPSDMGADLSTTRIDTPVHAKTDQVVHCEPSQLAAQGEAEPLAARLKTPHAGSTRAKTQELPTSPKASALPPEPAGRRGEQQADVPTTLLASAAPPVFRSTTPVAPNVSVAAARALQRELTRHGCYSGDIDGDWGPASRYAAATFIQAVNAKLPTDKPDSILLALARGHQGPSCTQGSGIITASTTPIGGVAVTTDASPDRSGEQPPTSSVSPYAPRLGSAPRIVRGDGMRAPTDLTDMPLLQPARMDQGPRMSLGVEPPSAPGSEPASVTRNSTSQQKLDASRRAAERSGQRQARKRTFPKRWRQQVFQGLNLSGS
jgi:hypothetical protein